MSSIIDLVASKNGISCVFGVLIDLGIPRLRCYPTGRYCACVVVRPTPYVVHVQTFVASSARAKSSLELECVCLEQCKDRGEWEERGGRC